MIYLVYTANEEHNLALLKHAEPFIKQNSGKYYSSHCTHRPLEDLQPLEPLYIVGHGDRETPMLSGLSAKELFITLKNSGLSPYIKRLNIHLICCHSGHKTSPLALSFADELYDEFTKRLHDIELNSRSREGSLPTISAPKHIIGFQYHNKRPVGIKPKYYGDYALAKAKSPFFRDAFLDRHTEQLTPRDFQVSGPGRSFTC